MVFLLSPFLSLLAWPLLTHAVDTSDVSTGECAPVTWTETDWPEGYTATATVEWVAPTMPAIARNRTQLQPGDINCRYWHATDFDVLSDWCEDVARKWELTLDTFFFLNPGLLRDCSNLEPNAEYCILGFIEPLRSTDGFCGPQHNDATCLGTRYGQCCNSETWRCGETDEDCARGTCYEGACWGDAYYSNDGTCGKDHGDRLCAGKWGDCCSRNGQCGSGPEYCNLEVCQTGKCNWRNKEDAAAGTEAMKLAIDALGAKRRATSPQRYFGSRKMGGVDL